MDDSIDLTAGYVPPGRSRRAADQISTSKPNDVWEVLDLEFFQENKDESLNETEVSNQSRKRKTRSGKAAATNTAKTPKVKRLTYKQALKVVSAPPVTSKSKAKMPSPPKKKSPAAKKSPRVAAAARTSHFDGIDLTGDVELTEIHSKAPLFQRTTAAPHEQDDKVVEEPDNEIDMLDLDMINVKVKTQRGIEIFKMKTHQKLQYVFIELSKKESVPLSKIFIFNNDKRVDPEQTPYDIGYKFSTILKLTVMDFSLEGSTPSNGIQKKNQIELKFQWDKDRHKYKSEKGNRMENFVTFKVSKFDSFKVIIDILCEKVELKPHQVHLTFDGDDIDLANTPEDEGFEGGETLDCKISAS